MDLIVLGSHGTWPEAGGATSGLLVREEGFCLWVDMGTGTLAELQRHVGLFDVDALLISHSHPDHVTDVYAYLFARLFSPDQPPKIPLFVAPRVVDRVQPLLADDSTEMKLSQAFDVTEVTPGQELTAGPFRIVTGPMRHTVPTVGVRVEAGDRTVAYSADTGPTDDLVALAAGAVILVAEASWQEDGGDRPPIHLTAREAGQAAARSGAGRLVLTHIRPYLDRDRSRAEAAGVFDGPVVVPADGDRMEVG